jgi:AbrB family looped-hinge helix DNA binding protein
MIQTWCHICMPKTRIAEGGRIVIPAEYRRALGIKKGDEVTVSLEDDSLRVITPAQAVRRAQAAVRRYNATRRRLSRELIEERRQEGTRD